MSAPKICAECRHSEAAKPDGQNVSLGGREALFCKRFTYQDIVYGDVRSIPCRDARGVQWAIARTGELISAPICLDGRHPSASELVGGCGTNGRYWEAKE